MFKTFALENYLKGSGSLSAFEGWFPPVAKMFIEWFNCKKRKIMRPRNLKEVGGEPKDQDDGYSAPLLRRGEQFRTSVLVR